MSLVEHIFLEQLVFFLLCNAKASASAKRPFLLFLVQVNLMVLIGYQFFVRLFFTVE